MKHNRKARRRGNDGDSEENTRGLLKIQKKIIRRLEQRVKYLEKQLNLSEDANVDENAVSAENEVKKRICKNCHSLDMQTVSVHKPGGELKFWVCQQCRHREKI